MNKLTTGCFINDFSCCLSECLHCLTTCKGSKVTTRRRRWWIDSMSTEIKYPHIKYLTSSSILFYFNLSSFSFSIINYPLFFLCFYSLFFLFAKELKVIYSEFIHFSLPDYLHFKNNNNNDWVYFLLSVNFLRLNK